MKPVVYPSRMHYNERKPKEGQPGRKREELLWTNFPEARIFPE
jgi:hypothetical protein